MAPNGNPNPNPKPKISIPRHLVFVILVRLPPKDLIRFMCVGKDWEAMIHGQRFIDAHHQRSLETKSFRSLLIISHILGDSGTDFFTSSFYDNDTIGSTAIKIEQPLKDPEKRTRVVGYSHGLLCICNDSETEVALWNPSINKFKRIPFTWSEIKPLKMKERRPEATFGFGYDFINDDYKFVRMLEFLPGPEHTNVPSEVRVYSFKSNSWKRIGDLPSNHLAFESGVKCLDGALHWLIHPNSDGFHYRILALDLATEEYDEFCTPIDPEHDDDAPVAFTVLQGCLCFMVRVGSIQSDVWVMKEYREVTSWVMLYRIEAENVPWMFDYCEPLCLSKSGEMVLLENHCFELPEDYEDLAWYDIENKTGKLVKIHGVQKNFSVDICEGNLRLLDGDPVIVQRKQQDPSTSRKRKASCSVGSLDLLLEALEALKALKALKEDEN